MLLIYYIYFLMKLQSLYKFVNMYTCFIKSPCLIIPHAWLARDPSIIV